MRTETTYRYHSIHAKSCFFTREVLRLWLRHFSALWTLTVLLCWKRCHGKDASYTVDILLNISQMKRSPATAYKFVDDLATRCQPHSSQTCLFHEESFFMKEEQEFRLSNQRLKKLALYVCVRAHSQIVHRNNMMFRTCVYLAYTSYECAGLRYWYLWPKQSQPITSNKSTKTAINAIRNETASRWRKRCL